MSANIRPRFALSSRAYVDSYALADALQGISSAVSDLSSGGDLRASRTSIRAHVDGLGEVAGAGRYTTWDHRGSRTRRTRASEYSIARAESLIDDVERGGSVESIMRTHRAELSRIRAEAVAAYEADGMDRDEAEAFARFQQVDAMERAAFADAVLTALVILEQRIATRLESDRDASPAAIDLAAQLAAITALVLIVLAAAARTVATSHATPAKPPRLSEHRAASLAPRAPALPAFA